MICLRRPDSNVLSGLVIIHKKEKKNMCNLDK